MTNKNTVQLIEWNDDELDDLIKRAESTNQGLRHMIDKMSNQIDILRTQLDYMINGVNYNDSDAKNENSVPF